MKRILTLLLLTPIIVAGCVPQEFIGEISGTVTDINGNAVRDADIYADGSFSTTSSPVGTFVIRDATEGLTVVQARLTVDGVSYRGTNRAYVYAQERTNSVNIVVARVNQLGHVQGIVQDQFGRPLEGVRVFAGGPLGSWMDITDSNGAYRIDDLVAGYSYTMTASGRGYENDTTNFTANAGQTGTVNFFLRNSSNEQQNGVENLTAVAWTSPVDATRSRESARAYEAIKNHINPEREERTSHTRADPAVTHLEIDLFWDYEFYNELLGYGIYRGTSPANVQPLEVLRDPLANFYSDISDQLLENQRFYYVVTRLNTDFPNQSGSESPPSATVSAVPLDDMILNNVSYAPLTFRWQPLFNATSYTVYLYYEFPDFQVDPIWVSAPTPSTFYVYNGAPLDPGHRYWYVVVGSGFGGFSHSISQIDSFVAP
ncbi:MAG: carboxypeptidase regulatory-like domain-containing protein [Armatimonadetes bacterium]|nr:carboxypeptidase regulatory-like domain-containing protein [Armatimonadota bacterium]NOG92771.1 carboxypeptidase regulatory-like domain-containing protein [Armatimonadota bacterium]